MQKRHFEFIADLLRNFHKAEIVNDEQHARMTYYAVKALAGTNERFDRKKFISRSLESQKPATKQPQKEAQPA